MTVRLIDHDDNGHSSVFVLKTTFL